MRAIGLLIVALLALSVRTAHAQPSFAQNPQMAVLGVTRAVNLNCAAPCDTAVVLTAPTSGNWAMYGIYAYNVTGTATSHAGAWFGSTGGGGLSLGTMNLSSLTTTTARGFFPLGISPVGSTTIYFRTTTASGAAATADVAVIGILLP